MIRTLTIGLLTTALVVAALPRGEQKSPSRLEQVRERGALVMLTRNGASSYFEGADGPTGPEYELARAFADFIGVDLEVHVAHEFQDLAELLNDGEGDLVAANLTRTPERERQFRFGPDYAETRTLVVRRKAGDEVARIEELAGLRVAVIAGSSYARLLRDAAGDVPELAWQAVTGAGIEDLLLAIEHGELDATLVDESIYDINRQYYPHVEIAFALPEPQKQAWAFVRDDDDSLAQQAAVFLKQAREDGRLAEIRNRFFINRDSPNQVGMPHLVRRMRERLPEFLPIFQDVADQYGVDWRLLAAIGYQESHWDPLATSPTGVRGLMMLTNSTAGSLGVADRLDPRQSIEGGARYFLRMRDRVPARIPEPDRTWMALAAYNIGMGHLEDARVLTQRQGGDPDHWADVSQRLPLLTQEKYFRTTRHGYARGHEAQRYVRNIRNYFDVLVWMDTREHPLLVAQAD